MPRNSWTCATFCGAFIRWMSAALPGSGLCRLRWISTRRTSCSTVWCRIYQWWTPAHTAVLLSSGCADICRVRLLSSRTHPRRQQYLSFLGTSQWCSPPSLGIRIGWCSGQTVVFWNSTGRRDCWTWSDAFDSSSNCTDQYPWRASNLEKITDPASLWVISSKVGVG